MKIINVGSPLHLKNSFTSKNRFFKAAMSEQLADARHDPTEGLFKVYKRWAEGGFGVVLTGNVMVDRNHLGEPKNTVLDHNSNLELFRRWAVAGSANNTQLWMQLNHPGKQTPKFIQKHPVAPSAIPMDGLWGKNFNKPRELSSAEIEDIVEKFILSARLAKETGFSGIQIHAAHGYLISQFLSSRHNQRNDQWGGNLNNRMRFLLEICRGVRAEVGKDFPLSVKLNSADFMKGGFTEEESIQVAQALADNGVDLLEVSGGSYESPVMAEGVEQKQSSLEREAYFLTFAEQLKATVDIPIVVTGGFRSVEAMNTALSSGTTDMIGIARPAAVVPDLPEKALSDSHFRIDLRRLTTGISTLDQMILLNMSWYEAQFHRMASGKEPDTNLNEWLAAWQVFRNLGAFAFKKRRS